jgi:hypothetical protein
MKIIVCGDSFLTPDIRYPGAHFSEILANKHNHEVINLARGGMSNTGICFQFEQAVKLHPDIIIYGQTDSGRMAIPTGNFVRENGLKNFRYTDKVSATCNSEYVGDSNAPIVDDVMASLLKDSCWTTLSNTNKYNLTNEQREAIRQYITYLHDAELKEAMDGWAISYWRLFARHNGIGLLRYWDYMQKAGVDNAFKSQCVFHTTLQEQINTAELIAIDLQNNIIGEKPFTY